MKKRYHVVQSEPANNGEHEWNVLDRSQVHPNCEGCPGICVATHTTRKAAREAAAELEAESNSTCASTATALPSEAT